MRGNKKIFYFWPRIMHLKDANGIANSVDPDQTAPLESDLGLQGLPRPICPKT